MTEMSAMSKDNNRDITVSVPWSVQEDLLLDVVAPLLDESVELGETESWFYLRENHGNRPFLRLRFTTASPLVERRLKSHIVDHVNPLAGDDLFEYQPYNHEHDWLGGRPALGLAESFWTETTPLALRTLRATRGDRNQRLALAFDMLVCNGALLAPRLPPPLSKYGFRAGYLSYLATYEGYMLLLRDAESTRAKHTARYERNRELLRGRARELVNALSVPTGDLDELPGAAREWTLRLRDYLPAIQQGFDDGRFYLYATPRRTETAKLTPSPDGLYRRPKLEWLADLPEPPVAGIHRAIADNKYFQGMIREDRRFLATRLAQSYGSWHLFRLGLLLADRYMLFYLVSQAFEEEFDLDAAEIIRSLGPETEGAK